MRFQMKNPNGLAPFKPGDLIGSELVTDEVDGETWLEGFRPRLKRKR
jgi:hypothetical protein